MPFRVDTKTIYSILKLRNLYNLKSYPVGPNNWGIFLTLPVTTGEGIGPAGEISPVVCMLKNGLFTRVGIFENAVDQIECTKTNKNKLAVTATTKSTFITRQIQL